MTLRTEHAEEMEHEFEDEIFPTEIQMAKCNYPHLKKTDPMNLTSLNILTKVF